MTSRNQEDAEAYVKAEIQGLQDEVRLYEPLTNVKDFPDSKEGFKRYYCNECGEIVESNFRAYITVLEELRCFPCAGSPPMSFVVQWRIITDAPIGVYGEWNYWKPSQ